MFLTRILNKILTVANINILTKFKISTYQIEHLEDFFVNSIKFCKLKIV